jgi:magnesium chelatase family protein
MIAEIKTLTFNGIEVVDVSVQVHIAKGTPIFNIVGLPDKIIAESKERVRAALNSIALDIPPKRITVNLSPASLTKEGSHFDLPIAICLLAGLKILPQDQLERYLILGELALDGSILPVAGALPAAIGANIRNCGLICPYDNGSEVAWSGNDDILAPKNLLSLINHFSGSQRLSAPILRIAEDSIKYPDFKDVVGQELAKRALEIAAAGGHNILMIGTPGSGKSMLASRLPSILPEMSAEEILETSMIYSVSGQIKSGQLQKTRPFRSPHHTSSMIALVGGGHSKRIMPGEISLAHNGVLFLDELPEFSRATIDSLRQPIESRVVNISRANSHVTYPTRFQLVAAMNPCKCGYLSDPNRACSRAPICGEDYQSKISGPIMDRIDIVIEVNENKIYNTLSIKENETSESIKKRVVAARNRQLERYNGYGIAINAELEGELLYEMASLDNQTQELLNKFADKNKISMRSYNRILKVSRTIADLEGVNYIKKYHLAEAISYKQDVKIYGAGVGH